MSRRKMSRHAADTKVRTPLTDLTDALGANGAIVGRRAAVAVASLGLVGTLGLSEGQEPATADTEEAAAAESQTRAEVPNAAFAAVDTEAASFAGGLAVEGATAAPEPEPEPEATPATNGAGSSSSSSSSQSSSESGSSAGEDVALPDGDKASQVIALARQYVGVPYVSGGTTPSGWDCSGFTQYVFNQVGVSLPRTSGAQRNAGRVVSAAEAKPGDLVWRPGHVGIYAGNGMMYDAGSPRSNTSYRSHSWMGSVTYIRVL